MTVSFRCIAKVLLPTCVIVLISSVIQAQLIQPSRYECEQKSSAYNFTVISLNDQGLALLHQLEKYEGNKNHWELVLLDSTLQKTWETEIEQSTLLNLIGYDYIDENVYFLFRMGSGDLGALHLIQINVRDHLVNTYEIETKLDFTIGYFNVVGNSAVLGGYVGRQPALFLHELATGRIKVVPGFLVKNTELLDVRANNNGTFNVVLMDKSSSEKKQLIIRTFDASGALILDDAIDVDADKTLLTGIASTLVRDELLVTGTWGQPAGRIALGIYTVPVDPFSSQLIQYYDFSQFEHFLDFNKPKKAARIKAQSARRRKSGKLPTWGTYVNAARLVENRHGFVLLSEVYSPMSTSQYTSSSPAYTNPYYYNGIGNGGYNPYGFNSYNPRFSPYPYGGGYSHRSDVNIKFSSIAIFDHEGKLVDDTGMKIGYLRLPSLDQLSDFSLSAKSVDQLYREDKQIIVSRTLPDTIARSSVPIRLSNEKDVLRSEQNNEGALRYWYGQWFFVWGYQEIKGTEGGGTRTVFYVNKIKVG